VVIEDIVHARKERMVDIIDTGRCNTERACIYKENLDGRRAYIQNDNRKNPMAE